MSFESNHYKLESSQQLTETLFARVRRCAPPRARWAETDRESVVDTYFKSTLQTAMFFKKCSIQGCSGVGNFEQDLVDLVNGKKVAGRSDAAPINVKLADVKSQGYWPVTKAVLAEVRRTMALVTDSRLLLSGFSQGGGRAQLARMWMEKEFSEKPVVITFAAVGAACFPRDLDGPGRTNLLQDVDPTRLYTVSFESNHYKLESSQQLTETLFARVRRCAPPRARWAGCNRLRAYS